MAGSETSTEAKMTKIIKPRVEIDTSPPFESVKEAVNLFSRGSTWIPHPLLPPEVDQQSKDIYDVNKMEEHTAQLERVLINRERETLEVLRELGESKQLVEDLKLNLAHGGPLATSPNARTESYLSTPNIVLTDVNHARVNLNKTWIDLAVIRASAESLNKKMRRKTDLLQTSSEHKIPDNLGLFSAANNQNLPRETPQICHYKEVIENTTIIPEQHSQFNFEAEQFKKLVEASRYEIMKAMSEMERTKVCIRMAELRLDAARKIEEAAKAVEAIAFAERTLKTDELSPSHLKQEEITLSLEEYNALTRKAKQAEEMYNTKFLDGRGSRKTKTATQFSETCFRKKEQQTEATFKKNSLEAVFGSEGIFRREDLEGSPYNNFQDSWFSSATPKYQNMHRSDGRKDSSLLNGTRPSSVEEKTVPVYQSTISFGDILRRKLILQDDFMLRNHAENQDERQQVSQNEIISKRSGFIFKHTKSTTDGRRDKHYIEQKKKFGFIHVVLPKHRNKNQA